METEHVYDYNTLVKLKVFVTYACQIYVDRIKSIDIITNNKNALQMGKGE